ncbi:hypothetical protein [Halobaculum limi]|uniref:hypothetical protein n=1 Tax=Halobaculum limi TaxID=3031916 RepID=UPI002404997A|nr:hypothetical protein [Halobaculum sp. YSMS11]
MTRFDIVADGGRDEDAPRTSDPLAPDSEPEDLLGTMLRAGILTEGEDGDLYLTKEFESAWTGQMSTLRSLDQQKLIEATAQAVPFEAEGERAYDGIRIEGQEGVAWLRPTNAIADVAAVLAMEAFDVPDYVRAPAATPLRLFTPECPSCGGDVVSTISRDGSPVPPESGREANRKVLACTDCGAEVHELSAQVED